MTSLTWLEEIENRWPGTKVVTEGEFGLEWRKSYQDNSKIDYRFVERGTGAPGSEESKQIRWFMNKDFRLALLCDVNGNGPEEVIDFTRYDLPASEPDKPQREWSLMNVINQKRNRPQDKPRPLQQLSHDDQGLVFSRYSNLR